MPCENADQRVSTCVFNGGWSVARTMTPGVYFSEHHIHKKEQEAAAFARSQQLHAAQKQNAAQRLRRRGRDRRRRLDGSSNDSSAAMSFVAALPYSRRGYE